MSKKQFAVSILSALMLLIVALAPTSTQQAGEYDPWVDLNDDGAIDIYDIISVATRFGSEGTSISKASVEYDSGWIDITDKCGKGFTITHNLNSTDIMVDITGKTTVNGGVHQKYLGLTDYTSGWPSKNYSDISAFATPNRLVGTLDGGFAIAGTRSSKSLLAKMDQYGNMQWSKTYANKMYDAEGTAVAQTKDGGYAVAGYTDTISFGYNFILVKTDAYGNMQWNRTYGNYGDDHAYSMIQTLDEGYVIAGDSDVSGATDGVLAKTEIDGTLKWGRTYGGGGNERFCSVIPTEDEGYAITGHKDYNIWLVKTDFAGNVIWNYTYASGIGSAVVQTVDGGYAIAAYSGNVDLVKTDSNGILQWTREYESGDEAYSILRTTDGGYAMAGRRSIEATQKYDFWLVKTDVSGNMLWSQTCDSTRQDFAFSMVQTEDGGFALVGLAEEFGLWLAKMDIEYGLAWADSTANNITLYRGATDPYWNYVRVRIWNIKETP